MTPYAARAHIAACPRSPEQARVATADWLLGGVQLGAGPHAGGVAGAIDGDGRPLYIYPEITGYYLQWLAWTASRRGATPALTQRANAAQRWLASWIGRCDPPETRVHLRAHEAEWRNSASFCFDLAMVLRGVASATAAGLIESDPALVERLYTQLSRLTAADGEFLACNAPSGVALPDRWSTRRGGFLSKAAAAVLAAARVLPQLPATLRAAAEATFAASIRTAIAHPHDETHPRLYAIEGALMLASHPAVVPALSQLTDQLDRLLRSARLRGALSETGAAGGAERLDIVAQGVRAACLLKPAAPGWSPDQRALDRMQHFLVRYTALDGAVAFNTAAGPKLYCAWAAMFAEQALTLSGMAPAGLTRDEAAAYIV
jgi:hypothetical protein